MEKRMNVTNTDLPELIKRQETYCTCAWDTSEYDHNKACPVTLISELSAARQIEQVAQAILTALNVGDVQSGSPLHLKLREVMIAYRAERDTPAPKDEEK